MLPEKAIGKWAWELELAINYIVFCTIAETAADCMMLFLIIFGEDK